MNYGNDKNFERAPDSYILQKGDRMRRTNAYSASSLEWFRISGSDIGTKADYFNHGGGFEVQRMKPEVRRSKESQ